MNEKEAITDVSSDSVEPQVLIKFDKHMDTYKIHCSRYPSPSTRRTFKGAINRAKQICKIFKITCFAIDFEEEE